MALGENFYNEIFEHEQKWIELINSNLLNSIYCNLTLKPFYLQKIVELKSEYNKTNNEKLKQMILMINDIIDKIELFNYQYLNYKTPNINSLLPLFLIARNNNLIKEDNKYNEIHNQIDKLQLSKHIIQNHVRKYDSVDVVPDYVYDDFPGETRIVK